MSAASDVEKRWADELANECYSRLLDASAPITTVQTVHVVEALCEAVAHRWSRHRDSLFFEHNKLRAVGFIIAATEATMELAEHGSAGLDKVMGKWGN